MRRIDYFLTAASPWAYLGHAEFRRIAARHGAEIVPRPMPVRLLFAETGGLPLPQRHPSRQAYRLVELQRWRALRGVALDLQPRQPLLDATRPDGVAIALVGAGHDPMPFLGAAMAGLWAEGRQIADPEVLRALLRECGLPESFEAAADDERVAETYAANLADAQALGIFGAPSYVLDGEVFWGQDRLALLDDALASRRPAYRPA